MKQAPKKESGGRGRGFPSFLPHPLSALLLALYFAPSLTFVPRSLLLKRTETLAPQAESTVPAGGGGERGFDSYRVKVSEKQSTFVVLTLFL